MIDFSGRIKIEKNKLGIETIFDPESGREYCCKILINPIKSDREEVRDYLAFPYRTRIWKRASS